MIYCSCPFHFGGGRYDGAVLSDSAGCLHLKRVEFGSSPTYIQRGISGAWREQFVKSSTPARDSVMVLSPAGVPYMAYLVQSDGNMYVWSLGQTSAQKANPPNAWSDTWDDLALVVTSGTLAEVPHLLRVYHQSGPKDRHLVYSYREGGSWTHKVIGSDGQHSCGTCVIGNKCTVDYFVYSLQMPLVILASASGDVRMFYVRIKRTGQLTGTYSKYSGCYWKGGSETYQLRMAWLESGKIKTARIKDNFAPHRMHAEVGPAGDIHLMEGYGRYYMVIGK